MSPSYLQWELVRFTKSAMFHCRVSTVAHSGQTKHRLQKESLKVTRVATIVLRSVNIARCHKIRQTVPEDILRHTNIA